VEPAPLPPLPEVPAWMRERANRGECTQEIGMLIGLVDYLRARGGR